jgi:hypothetical protein
MTREDYLRTLSVVDTASLPFGGLFWANDALYEVIEVDLQGHSRARRWGGKESTDVALVPNSSLARRLPTVGQGYAIPALRSREALLHEGQFLSFVFPVEQNALDAANMDCKLCGTNSGLYVRRLERNPGFEVTNGMMILRRYYYMRINEGMETNLRDIKHRLQEELVRHHEGPMYWRLVPSWDDGPYDTTQTLRMSAIDLRKLRNLEDTVPGSTSDKTLLNRPND